MAAATNPVLDELSINTIRTLAMDAVQVADSGHPGTPMAMAPVVYCLWQHFLRFDPGDPIWPNRDRFVLSMGDASTLLWSLLYLTGVKAVDEEYKVLGDAAVSLEDIYNFRQLGGKFPGHPEYRWTSGVEATTGPLGQGIATSVGMAVAERWLADHFNRSDFLEPLFDYDVYAVCGDGCLMEGISHEAASLAGHLKLSNLCWIYDHNHVTIEGQTALACSDNVALRFQSYGWHVLRVADADDQHLLARAFRGFKATHDRPTLIVVDSHIGYGSLHRQDASATHGKPLSEAEIRLTKRGWGCSEDAWFPVPDGVREHFVNGIGKRGAESREAWLATVATYAQQYPELARELGQLQRHELPDGWDAEMPTYPASTTGLATRESSGEVLNTVAKHVPWLIGGAADLHFSAREHCMGAVLNGLALSKLRPYGSGFLIFSDYAKPTIRLSALMELSTVYIFTQDSIGVGEDGPTHQSVEQLAGMRAIPGLVTLRPSDANEVVEAWRWILAQRHQPVVLVLSRQSLPTLDRSVYAPADGLARGAYVLADTRDRRPEVLLMASGSEVSLCVPAYQELTAQGIKTRLVSMPSWELFERQDSAYRESVLPSHVRARVAVEQASTFGWEHYVGLDGTIVGMHTSGASAPVKDLHAKFGFAPETVIKAAKAQLGLRQRMGVCA
jgi:transketolase